MVSSLYFSWNERRRKRNKERREFGVCIFEFVFRVSRSDHRIVYGVRHRSSFRFSIQFQSWHYVRCGRIVFNLVGACMIPIIIITSSSAAILSRRLCANFGRDCCSRCQCARTFTYFDLPIIIKSCKAKKNCVLNLCRMRRNEKKGEKKNERFTLKATKWCVRVSVKFKVIKQNSNNCAQ